LRNALDYTLFIPSSEPGIRRFCLWALGLAVLTLQKIHKNLGFTAGSQVKISRRAVTMTRLLTDISVRNDWMLRRLFAAAARGLPLARLSEVRRPSSAAEARVSVRPDAQDAVDALALVEEPMRRRSYGGSGT
jgi:farnesyl-diphosphate farnesyltransferase